MVDIVEELAADKITGRADAGTGGDGPGGKFGLEKLPDTKQKDCSLGIAIGFLIPPILVKNSEVMESIGAGLSTLFYSVAILTSVLLVLILIFFQGKPPLPPSPAQAVQTQRRVCAIRHLYQTPGYQPGLCIALGIVRYQCWCILRNIHFAEPDLCGPLPRDLQDIGFLFTGQTVTVAFWRSQDQLYLFDPHPVDEFRKHDFG
ncbi:uncharacterized protein LOC124373389 [Homalodisca vitripennis]|uniref:uncharacterized protein LOC124373389 n=1 Tax=Homalodisca vitripennis TaxID=197043 RepID=UPI001EEBBAB6|nr:uncharacterized protein LOC124373389 [Homalodisca vitripennis]